MINFKLRIGLLVSLFTVLLCSLGIDNSSTVVYADANLTHATTPQLERGTRKLKVTHEDVGDTRIYTIHDVMLNDDPYVIETGYGRESVGSLYKRSANANNGHLIFQSNVKYILDMYVGLGTGMFAHHTGWSGKLSVRPNNTGSWVVPPETQVNTTNGYINESYSFSELSDSINANLTKIPVDLLEKLKTMADAKVFKTIEDSRDKREQRWSIDGGFQFVATSTTPYYNAGDGVQLLYYDNIVYVTAKIDVPLPSTCPDGSPKPPNGDCGGKTELKCPDGSPLPPSGKVADCTTPTIPDIPSGGGGGGGEKTCHPTAQGSYPSCSPKPFNLTGELEKQKYPTWGTGSISWGLSKVTKSAAGGSATQIASTNLLPIGSGHYEARTPSYSQSGVMSGSQGKTTPKNVSASDKGTQSYKVSYDYTDYYIETYKCLRPSEYSATQSVKTTTTTITTTTDEEGKESTETSVEESWEDYTVTAYDYSTCYTPVSDSSPDWQYVSERANWAKGETYSCSQSLAVDHSYGATLTGTNSATGTWNIGRSANVSAYANSCNISSSNVYTETLTHTSAHKDLNTQTYLPFVENPVVWQGNPNY